MYAIGNLLRTLYHYITSDIVYAIGNLLYTLYHYITSKVLCYKSGGRWFDPSWYQWIFH